MSQATPDTAQHQVTEVVGSSRSSDTKADVIIIGGGIGGLAAATALRQQGLTVKVFERAGAFGEVGAGMQIAPNCTRILGELGLLDEAKSLGVMPSSMIMYDGVDGTELTRLDLRDLERKYGSPYMVIHRSDLHGIFLRAAQREGVELVHGMGATAYENTPGGATVTFEDGYTEEAEVVIAADGIHSVARAQLVGDPPVSSSYVAYRGAMPIEMVKDHDVDTDAVVLYIGPGYHFVQYPLRSGDMFNQVAVFESPKAYADDENWGAPDELDAAFAGACPAVQQGLPLMWRDRWWRMFDREPIMDWVDGRIALLGDSAHAPLQYMAQGAIMAIEDGWVLAQHVAAQTPQRTDSGSGVDWEAALAAYNAVRPEHCKRVLETGRIWGILWHRGGLKRVQRNAILRARDTYDYSFTEWIYGPTALKPADEPNMFTPIPLDSVTVDEAEVAASPKRPLAEVTGED